MFWINFSEQKPTKEGKYLIAYTNFWKSAIWEDGQWKANPDKYGYHVLCDPVWWAEVSVPY